MAFLWSRQAAMRRSETLMVTGTGLCAVVYGSIWTWDNFYVPFTSGGAAYRGTTFEKVCKWACTLGIASLAFPIIRHTRMALNKPVLVDLVRGNSTNALNLAGCQLRIFRVRNMALFPLLGAESRMGRTGGQKLSAGHPDFLPIELVDLRQVPNSSPITYELNLGSFERRSYWTNYWTESQVLLFKDRSDGRECEFDKTIAHQLSLLNKFKKYEVTRN